MRTSIINNRDAVAEAIAKSESIKEVLINLNLRAAGGNYKALKSACLRHGLTLPQIDPHSQTLNARRGNKIPDEEVFVENSTYTNRNLIKKRLYALGIPKECSECGQEPVWNGKPLVLTLEHINGVWNDNRLDNLTILCPNCHSQTETFCGGNR